MTLNVKAFALTMALIWGIGLFIATWWLIYFEGNSGDVTFISQFYRGYNISASGSIIGFGWAFIDGFVGGALFAWLYNTLLKRFSS